MRSFRPAALAGAVLGVLLLSSAPAAAGGPTSVLIVSPEHRATASLYTTDDDYELLARALVDDPAPELGPRSANLSPGGRQISVTWMIHDVSIWRLDRIQLDSDGEPWIYTQKSLGGSVDASSEGVWHRSPHPDELLDLLDRLGLLGQGAAKPVADGTPADEDDTTAAEPTTGLDPIETSAAGTDSWTLPALAGGIVAGVLGDRLIRRRGRRRDDRWVLVDAKDLDDERR